MIDFGSNLSFVFGLTFPILEIKYLKKLNVDASMHFR